MEPTLKVLSPEKTALVWADGIESPAGNSLRCTMASTESRPGILGRVESYIEMVR